MKIKIEIKNRWTGSVLFEFEKENNTIKDTLIEAVNQKAYLRGAYLRGAYDIPFIPFSCPSDGSFIGWKKIEKYLIKLEIPADAKRQSATGTKCRCDKAKVLEILDLKTNDPIESIVNEKHQPYVEYKVGEMVYPDSFDDNRWEEYSHGIHFFINKQEAIDY